MYKEIMCLLQNFGKKKNQTFFFVGREDKETMDVKCSVWWQNLAVMERDSEGSERMVGRYCH